MIFPCVYLSNADHLGVPDGLLKSRERVVSLYNHILVSVVICGGGVRLSMWDVDSDMSRPGLVRTVTGAKPEHRRETVKAWKEAFCWQRAGHRLGTRPVCFENISSRQKWILAGSELKWEPKIVKTFLCWNVKLCVLEKIQIGRSK